MGSMAVLVSAPLPDCDLLDNRANNLVAELVDTAKHCLLPFAIYVYYRFSGSDNNLYGMDMEQLKMAVLPLLVWFVMLHFTVVSPHRGWSHSIIWLVVFTYLWNWMIPNGSYKWFAIGYASHLGIDLLNKVGEPLLFPAKWRPCLKVCGSDGLMNKAILCVSVIWCAYLMYYIKEGIRWDFLEDVACLWQAVQSAFS